MKSPLFLLCTLAVLQGTGVRGDGHLDLARDSAVILQTTWYNGNTGLYNSTGWWNSANVITTLADMTYIYPTILDRTTHEIFNNTFNRAQQQNLGVLKTSPTFDCDAVHDECPRQATKAISDSGWLNNYFDDEGWWALAWIAVWDLTKDDHYLDAATDIFNDMVNNGLNGACGGMWWNKAHTSVNAITNGLFISVAAHLANRHPNGDYYLGYAKKQWDWFLKSGLINSEGLINDGLDLTTCKNSGDVVWS